MFLLSCTDWNHDVTLYFIFKVIDDIQCAWFVGVYRSVLLLGKLLTSVYCPLSKRGILSFFFCLVEISSTREVRQDICCCTLWSGSMALLIDILATFKSVWSDLITRSPSVCHPSHQTLVRLGLPPAPGPVYIMGSSAEGHSVHTLAALMFGWELHTPVGLMFSLPQKWCTCHVSGSI